MWFDGMCSKICIGGMLENLPAVHALYPWVPSGILCNSTDMISNNGFASCWCPIHCWTSSFGFLCKCCTILPIHEIQDNITITWIEYKSLALYEHNIKAIWIWWFWRNLRWRLKSRRRLSYKRVWNPLSLNHCCGEHFNNVRIEASWKWLSVKQTLINDSSLSKVKQ